MPFFKDSAISRRLAGLVTRGFAERSRKARKSRKRSRSRSSSRSDDDRKRRVRVIEALFR